MKTQQAMAMKTRILFALGVGLATASQAWAAGPIGAVRLGGLDAALTFCGQVNPAGVAAYTAYRTALLSQNSAESIAAMPKGKVYKQAFAEVGTSLSSAPAAWAVKACARAVTLAGA